MGSPHWPLFDLRIRTPRVELRPIDDATAFALLEVVKAGVHPPAFMPFTTPWTDLPDGERERSALQHWWRTRAELTPARWRIEFAVRADGELVGAQGIDATDFAVRRTASTGSWLGLASQGRGIGREMRAAVLHFAFAGLDAQRCESAAFPDNAASLGVSRALGYIENGEEIALRRGVAERVIRLRLDRETWERHRRDDIEIEGLEPCLALLGLAPQLAVAGTS